MTLLTHLRLPVIGAPMFLLSSPELVIASCRAGILGSFPALNARTTEELDQWLTRIKAEIGDRPFGVNLIVHPSNPRVEADLKVLARHKVPLVITSLGAVSELVKTVHDWGGQVFHDVVQRRHAEKRHKRVLMESLRCVPVPVVMQVPKVRLRWPQRFARSLMGPWVGRCDIQRGRHGLCAFVGRRCRVHGHAVDQHPGVSGECRLSAADYRESGFRCGLYRSGVRDSREFLGFLIGRGRSRSERLGRKIGRFGIRASAA